MDRNIYFTNFLLQSRVLSWNIKFFETFPFKSRYKINKKENGFIKFFAIFIWNLGNGTNISDNELNQMFLRTHPINEIQNHLLTLPSSGNSIGLIGNFHINTDYRY